MISLPGKSKLLNFEDDSPEQENPEKGNKVEVRNEKFLSKMKIEFSSQSQEEDRNNLVHSQKAISFSASHQPLQKPLLALNKKTSLNGESIKEKVNSQFLAEKKPNRLLALGNDNGESEFDQIINLNMRTTKHSIQNQSKNAFQATQGVKSFKKVALDMPPKESLLGQTDKVSNNSEPSGELQADDEQEESSVQNKNEKALFYPSQESSRVSEELAARISSVKDVKALLNFVMTPIPQNVNFKFEIHQYNKFLATEYQFWHLVGDQMNLVMRGFVDNAYLLSRTSYHLYLAGSQNEKRLLANITSDFKRSNYNILYANSKAEGVILGSTNSKLSIHLRKRDFYIPNVNQKTHLPVQIFQNSFSQNLEELHKVLTHKDQIKKYRTSALSAEDWFYISKKEGFQKSNRTQLVSDQNSNYKFFIGKVSTNRFRVLAGSGFNPLQLFAFSIVLTQK